MSEILSSKIVTTRKPHRCFGCDKAYPMETEMQRASVKDGNTVFTSYLCETCQEVVARFTHYDEFGEGQLYNGDPDYWNEIDLELHPQ